MKLLFITDYKETKRNISSTQVAINNLLRGFIENGIEVSVLGVVDKFNDIHSIEEELLEMGAKPCLIQSKINNDRKGKYRQLFMAYRSFFFSRLFYRKAIARSADDYDFVVACCPGLEAGIIQKLYRKKNASSHCVQIWTDPYCAIGLESVQKLPNKRKLLRWLERRILRPAEKIFYFTKVLCDLQKNLFPEFASKIDYYDGCSTVSCEECAEDVHFPVKLIGYSGSFNPVRRDINPICAAAGSFPDLDFLIRGGGGQLKDFSFPNLVVSNSDKRLPREEVLKIERSFDINVCVCDKKGFMVPGKVFMQASLPNFVLVLLDGHFQKEIIEYLSSFKRFVFAKNNVEDIARAINSILSLDGFPYSQECLEQFSSKKMVEKILAKMGHSPMGGIQERS